MPPSGPGDDQVQRERIPLEDYLDGGTTTASARQYLRSSEASSLEEAELLTWESAQTSAPRNPSSASSAHRRRPYIDLDRTGEGPGFLIIIMEKIKDTKIARFVDKLAVSSEPGLTNAQLMLTNHDLKPGMTRRSRNCYMS